MIVVEFTGTLFKALDSKGGVSQSNGQPWKSQEFVLLVDNKPIAFEIFGENDVNQFVATHPMGQTVTVRTYVHCREWSGRYFTALRYLSPQAQQQPVQQPMQPPQVQGNTYNPTNGMQPAGNTYSGQQQQPQYNQPSSNLPF